MEITEFLSHESILLNLKAKSKKQALQEISECIATTNDLTKREIFEVLLEREKLGSTGVGGSIAIPHGKIDTLDNVTGCFAKLEQPIEFDSIDKQPVDLIFVLLAPEEAGGNHLKALALVSRLFKNPKFCEKLRNTESVDAIYSLLINQGSSKAA